MSGFFLRRFMRILLPSLAILALYAAHAAHAADVPPPTADAPLATDNGSETIVLAGGCFWGMQAVFEHVKGVTRVLAGYAGGTADTAHYETVSTGTTGHAEAVQVTYDPSKITTGQILRIYFAVAHDPTELDRQGPDSGPQYRSTIFYATPEQQEIAEAYIAQLQVKKVFDRPIVTKVEPLKGFYQAEAYHQDYALRHPDDPYIAMNDRPKVEHLHKQFPQLYLQK